MRQNLQIFASPASSSPEILPIYYNFGKHAICQNRVSSDASSQRLRPHWFAPQLQNFQKHSNSEVNSAPTSRIGN
jgi:hypothetical protein